MDHRRSDHPLKWSFRVRISLNTTTGFAVAMPTAFINTASSARKKGFVAFSRAIVDAVLMKAVGMATAKPVVVFKEIRTRKDHFKG